MISAYGIRGTPAAPTGYEANSTQAVCALTGEHGAYVERPADYTQTMFGVNSGDSGSSFVAGDRVWWLFGNSGPTVHAPWTPGNATSRWPAITTPLSDPVAIGSDSIATSPVGTRPPRPAVPYDGRQMPTDQRCPALSFVRQAGGPGLAYANPSVSDDPLFRGEGQFLSLRTGELPEAGITEGSPAREYVVFGTDNPANCASVQDVTGPCAEPVFEAIASVLLITLPTKSNWVISRRAPLASPLSPPLCTTARIRTRGLVRSSRQLHRSGSLRFPMVAL